MITNSKLNRMADVILREAIGFPNEESYHKYLKEHPKADPKNHWVESDPGKKTPKSKTPEIYKVPEKIGRGSNTIDMTKSVLRASTPEKDGSYKWYGFDGKEVKDKDILFRADRLARELSVTSPSLVNVRVFTDYRPHSKKPFAMVYKDTWEKQKKASPFKYFYTKIQTKEGNEKIMAKNVKFSKAFTAKTNDIVKDAANGNPEAVVIHFINRHHIRIGTKGQKNDGICTMKAKYCSVAGDTVEIKDMPVKSNKKYSAVINDPILVKEFKKRLAKAKPDDLVFGDTDDKKVNQYLKDKLGDKSFSNKNLRTCEATGIAFDIVTSKAVILNKDGTWKPKPLTLDERYAIMIEACKTASAALNNTPDVCHSNYIDSKAWNILALPDNVFHKENPIEKVNEDGSLVFKWESKIDRKEDKIRKASDDDRYSIWDKYVEARDAYLQKLNVDRKKDGDTEVSRLPEIHANHLISRFLESQTKKR